jgi:UDP-N-acetylglucosamine 1-carboxyvinyltransferase
LEQLIISGRRRLQGSIAVSGAKNAALAVIPAALCAGAPCVIDNLPVIDDVFNYVDILRRLGAGCDFLDRNTLRIDPSSAAPIPADFDSARKIRASYYVLGALLGRFGEAAVTLPGGCNFGSRPIDLHIKGFEALGAEVRIEHGIVYARADRLVGAHVYLNASVGATINVMLAAINAEGVTVIENAAREPHVVDVANFLNFIGADIKGAGTDTIRISGKEPLRGGDYTIIPDMIETGTYMIAGAVTGGDVTVSNIIPKHMESLTSKLKEMDCGIEEGEDAIRVMARGQLSPASIKTQVYPGFPTDLQPQMTALLATINGASSMTETVFDNRFQYIGELERLGAKITLEGRTALIDGGVALTGAEVTATDLRGGIALIIAGLSAYGETRLNNVHYVDRGYEDFEDKLRYLGADITRRETAVFEIPAGIL